MTGQSIEDILKKIAYGLDSDEIVERLGIDSVELCDILSDKIAENLEKFEDVFEDYIGD